MGQRRPDERLLPAGGSIEKDTLVWEIAYTGAQLCHNRPLRFPGPVECNARTWVTLIDATTGEFIGG